MNWDIWMWIVLAIVVWFVVIDVITLWSSLRVSAIAGEDSAMLTPADGDDYTYAERPEMLLSAYDVRTYPERADERMAALEEAIRKLERRITALEGR